MADGINSKERVKEFGEVFTPDSIVNDMLDLVDEQLEHNESYIDKTYLEPACGDGQFLIRILYRKLKVVEQMPLEKRPLGLVRALASIYGVDIQGDNVVASRNRMYLIATGKSVETFDLNGKTNVISVQLGIEYNEQLLKVIKYILDNNIIVGDTLSGNVDFVSYHFNGDKISIAKANINELDNEMGRTIEVVWTSLPSLEVQTEIESNNLNDYI